MGMEEQVKRDDRDNILCFNCDTKLNAFPRGYAKTYEQVDNFFTKTKGGPEDDSKPVCGGKCLKPLINHKLNGFPSCHLCYNKKLDQLGYWRFASRNECLQEYEYGCKARARGDSAYMTPKEDRQKKGYCRRRMLGAPSEHSLSALLLLIICFVLYFVVRRFRSRSPSKSQDTFQGRRASAYRGTRAR